jgi:hypothetical protein
MQVCWILLAESGEFSEKYPLRLIKVKDPKFGPSKNIEVELGTSLPQIVSLKNRVQQLEKDLIPKCQVDTKHGRIIVSNIDLGLAPIEVCYYRYFVECKLFDEESERFSSLNVSLDFVKKIYTYHKEMFFDLENNRMDMKTKYIKKDYGYPIQTFRGHISKINKKIKQKLSNETLKDSFKICSEGTRGARYYYIRADNDKFLIK